MSDSPVESAWSKLPTLSIVWSEHMRPADYYWGSAAILRFDWVKPRGSMPLASHDNRYFDHAKSIPFDRAMYERLVVGEPEHADTTKKAQRDANQFMTTVQREMKARVKQWIKDDQKGRAIPRQCRPFVTLLGRMNDYNGGIEEAQDTYGAGYKCGRVKHTLADMHKWFPKREN